MPEEMIVTPWEVSGEIDYERLTREFGTQPITDELLKAIKKQAGSLHPQLTRRVFFSHRDFDWIMQRYEAGEQFVLYTGRGPSGDVHLGHIVPWIFTKYLQDAFGAKLYFQLTDDEKFLINPDMTAERAVDLSYDNALDVLAVGFDLEKIHFISDFKYSRVIYNLAVQIAKHVTFSTARAVFGFKESSNIGITFFPAVQAAPCFLESYFAKKKVPCLIPAAIDQDPYWRIARDVGPKLGYYKPAQIHCKFLPGLQKGGKMSSSMPETCIFTTDTPEVAEKKIMAAFTGGRATEAEQRKYGANPYICSVFYWYYYLFEPTEEGMRQIEGECKSGQILCGECKKRLSERVKKFLLEHQRRREAARAELKELFME